MPALLPQPTTEPDRTSPAATSKTPLLREAFAAQESRVHRTAVTGQVGSTKMTVKMPEAQC